METPQIYSFADESNILAGAIFGMPFGYPLCCLLTGIGASCCYLLSGNFGAELLNKLFASKIEYLRNTAQENKDRLIYFLLFLRLFPMTPNWLINMMSPIVGIPLHLFFVTVILGLMPYNYLCVQAGEMLTSLNSLEELFTWQTALKMGVMALVALGPSFLKR